MEGNPNRAEAERLLGIAEKLLQSRDFNGSRDFAILAQETEPLLDGSDQILAIAEVLIASEKRINNHHDWYSILQLDRRSEDHDLIKKQYRRLALLLHPDKNKFSFADHAFKLVADAWAVLNDPKKKPLYDNELSLFTKIDLGMATQSGEKLPVRRSWVRNSGKKQFEQQQGYSASETKLGSFWTACPYCYVLYEYPRVYEGCCLRCQNCKRAFHGAMIPSLPPLVPGKEAYYCCWGVFPIGFAAGSGEGVGGAPVGGFPNWMPPMFSDGQREGNANGGAGAERREGDVEVSFGSGSANLVRRKRGRPRKSPVLA